MNPPLPFSARETDGVLHLALDTPSSSVNIFSITAANQLVDILRDVSARTTRAVVLTSKKPRSFVNGVGLMLANAVKAPEDAARLTAPVKEAYSRLRELTVPTIAVIDGSCFGCGVELSLQCSHRVAIDSGDTAFYMTEIEDYLFVPVFGSTRDLPPLLGLEGATRFLLWGERWSARDALAHGLVDACVAKGDAEHAIGAIVRGTRPDETARTPRPSGDVACFAQETRARIARLPPFYRPVYEDCFALLEATTLGLYDDATSRAREVEACGRSAMTPASKAAQGFFFVRQIAEQLCRRGGVSGARTRVVLEGLPRLAATFAGRVYDDVEIVSADAAPTRADTRTIVFAHHDVAHALCVRVHDSRPSAPLVFDEGAAVYMPETGQRARFAEVVSRGDEGATVCALLLRLGLSAVRTQPRDGFVADAVIDVVAGVLDASARSGSTPSRAARALRDFGLIAMPHPLLAPRVGEGRAILDTDFSEDEAPDPDIVPSLLLSLLAWARTALADRTIAHPSVVDLVARDLLGFPLGHGSLCRHLTVERVRAWCAQDGARALVSATTIRSAEEYVSRGHDFYR